MLKTGTVLRFLLLVVVTACSSSNSHPVPPGSDGAAAASGGAGGAQIGGGSGSAGQLGGSGGSVSGRGGVGGGTDRSMAGVGGAAANPGGTGGARSDAATGGQPGLDARAADAGVAFGTDGGRPADATPLATGQRLPCTGSVTQNGPYVEGADSTTVPAGVTDWDPSKAVKRIASSVLGGDIVYRVFVPVALQPTTPAAVIVYFDGDRYANPNNIGVSRVAENLTRQMAVPPFVSVFVSADVGSDGAKIARFMIDELLVEVGKTYVLTTDRRLRFTAGWGDGGDSAFLAAWARPDFFGAALTSNADFADLAGAGPVADLIRHTPARPLRVYLLSGTMDTSGSAGSPGRMRPQRNRDVAAALAAQGYNHQFIFGDGAHGTDHQAMVFPQVLRCAFAP